MKIILKPSHIIPLILLAGLAIACPPQANSHGAYAQQGNRQQGGAMPKGGNELWQAAFNGDLSGVQSALEKGESPNSKAPGLGVSALVAASRNGHLDVVKFLVEHGANVNDQDNELKKSPLLASAWSRHLDVAEYLISKGANVNAQAHNGFTPLNDAAAIGDFQIVKFLMDHGADPRIADLRGRTPLQNAEDRLTKMSHGGPDRYPDTRGTPQDFKNIIEYLKQHGG
jgi:hypothetical protein